MLTRETLNSLLKAVPFIPFRLHLSDGGFVDVRHRELVNPGKSFAFVGIPDRNDPEAVFDAFMLVNYLHVTRVESLKPGPPPGGPTPPAENPVGSPA